MSNYNDIRNHTYVDSFNNNVQISDFSNENGLNIFGTKFHNFSFGVTTTNRPAQTQAANGGAWPLIKQIDVLRSIRKIPSNNYETTVSNSSWELMSTIVPMLYACWNGAEIQKAYWANASGNSSKPAQGSSVIINNTPEFLGIFNNVCIALYDNIISRQTVYDDIMSWHDNLEYIINAFRNQKSIHASFIDVQEVATNALNLLPTITLKDREILDIIYRNTGTEEITIKYSSSNGTIDTGPINPGAKLVIPSGADELEVAVPRYGYGEISFLRIGNNIYVRAI